MHLPRDLQQQFQDAVRGDAPKAVVRAMYDIKGNLGPVAMADGSLRGAEQQLFERFKLAIGMDAAEFQRLFDALLLKNNLAVLG